jgi:hypothetical protein
MAETKLWTRLELAERFGVSPAAVDKWRRSGRVQPFYTPGGRVRYILPADMQAVLDQATSEVTA